MQLLERGLLQKDCLAHPINWYTSSTNLTEVTYVLHHLEAFAPPLEELYPKYEHRSFGLTWPAIMIVRSSKDRPNKLFELLIWSQYLEKFDWKSFREGKSRKTTWAYSPTDCSSSWKPQPCGFFGEWLPHGLGTDTAQWPEMMMGRIRRFWRIASMWRDYHGLSQDEYPLEEDQDTFLRENPQLEPGRKHSGNWRPGEPASPLSSIVLMQV